MTDYFQLSSELDTETSENNSDISHLLYTLVVFVSRFLLEKKNLHRQNMQIWTGHKSKHWYLSLIHIDCGSSFNFLREYLRITI